MGKQGQPPRRQEVIGVRLGTRDKIERLKPMLEREKGVPISGSVALDVALNEAIAKREGKP